MGYRKDDSFLEKVLTYSPDLICAIDAEGNFRYVSAASQRILGYNNAEMVGKPFSSILHPEDMLQAMQKCLSAHEQGERSVFESRCLNQAGEEVIVEWSVSRPPADAVVMCVGRDVTAQEVENQQVRAQNELHRAVAVRGFDMIGMLNTEGRYTYVGGSTLKALGYQPEQVVGRTPFDFIHPSDLPAAQACWAERETQPELTVPVCRFLAASGEWRWMETIICNELQNPIIRSYTLSSRDVTERMKNSFNLAESEQRFRLLFENSSSLAVFQDTTGAILDINPAFLAFLKKSRSEVVNRQLQDFLPLEVRDIFRQKLEEALTGRDGYFEVVVQTEAGARRLKVNKLPLVVEGQIIGVHSAAEDITEMATAQGRIRQQAEEFATTLESITDAFFSMDKNWNLKYINREAERLLRVSREQDLGRNIWDIFPEEINGTFHRHYEQAFATGKTVRFESFFKRQNLWLEVKAYPSSAGIAIYFLDITQRVEAQKQLQLLALVAQGTDNGVIITDAAGRTEWVNDAFIRHTGYTLEEMVGRNPGAVLQGPETDPVTVQRIRERMKRRKPFSVTLLNYKKSGEKLWFAMDITPILNESGELTQFVGLLQNITYRKEVEASQAKMTQDLYRHNRDLQQFTYVISHNLRGPLANSLGLATMLTKVDKSSDAFATTLAHLRESMVQADAVLKDLNLVLSIRDKQDVVEQESVQLLEVCEQAVRHLEEPLQQRGGKVNLEVEKGLAVHGNRAYLYSIFYNLLSNSIKYRSEERPLEVDISCTRGEHGGPTISFTDNGSGFDMFKAGSDVFQLYKRFHTNQRGRGIGLFLVKTHVEALGGKIEVTSHVNVGTRFLIHLDQH